MEENLLTFEDLENLKLAEDLAKTCFEMYAVTSSGLAPEIAYFNSEVSCLYVYGFFLCEVENVLSSASHVQNTYRYIYTYIYFISFCL